MPDEYGGIKTASFIPTLREHWFQSSLWVQSALQLHEFCLILCLLLLLQRCKSSKHSLSNYFEYQFSCFGLALEGLKLQQLLCAPNRIFRYICFSILKIHQFFFYNSLCFLICLLIYFFDGSVRYALLSSYCKWSLYTSRIKTWVKYSLHNKNTHSHSN